MLTQRVITDISEILDQQDIWDSLLIADPTSTLFNSFAWVESWLQFYWAPDHILHLVVIEAGNKPVALLPLYYNSHQKKTMFLGTGEPERCEVASEYLDFLVNSEFVDQSVIYEFIVEYFNTQPNQTFEFTNCLETSHVFQISKRLNNVRYQETGKSYKLDLSNKFEQLEKTFSKNHRKKTREILNRFNKYSDISFHPLSGENFKFNWSVLRDLHTKDWESRGKPGAFSDKVFEDFHEYMHNNHSEFKQLFALLKKGSEVISIIHFYKFVNTLYFYATGSEKNKYKNLSPGILLHTLCISSLSGQHLIYDFMKGASIGSYKEKFCQSGEGFYTIRVFPRGVYGRLQFFKCILKGVVSKAKMRLFFNKNK